MPKVQIAIVGCGGMGNRHLRGIQALERSGLGNVELAGLVDPVRAHAELAAAEAETHFGRRPPIAASLEELHRLTPGVQAVDITTEPWLHHPLACEAFERGYHVMVEKPMGITVRACRLMVRAAERSGLILSVAENYRRDPLNRLARHLIETEAAGRIYFMMQHALGGGRGIFITPWRHDRLRGGFLLDLGVHFTDILQYYLGEFDEFFAAAERIEPIRYKPERDRPDPFYQQRLAQMPPTIVPTCEDFSAALIRMKSGATVSWSLAMAGQPGLSHRHLFGTKGRIDASPCARSGLPLKLKLDDRELVGKEILEAAPRFELDEVTGRLFGPRCTGYDAKQVDADALLLAIEYYDFARAILEHCRPEVDGLEGMTAVASLYGILESAASGQPVRMSEVLSGAVEAYQAPINAYHGIGTPGFSGTTAKPP
ncbi:MAG: Gfo/Idh/MocA family oxidoreductase [Planctomycetes bacterium]|nr:Gfo/Idh/MocA family oxidoreductase [Planctomycetota bacterium]